MIELAGLRKRGRMERRRVWPGEGQVAGAGKADMQNYNLFVTLVLEGENRGYPLGNMGC